MENAAVFIAGMACGVALVHAFLVVSHRPKGNRLMGKYLDELDQALGPVSPEIIAEVDAQFDALDEGD